MDAKYVLLLAGVFGVVRSDCDLAGARCCIAEFMTVVSPENGFLVTAEYINRTCSTYNESTTYLKLFESDCVELAVVRDLRSAINSARNSMSSLCSSQSELSKAVTQNKCLLDASTELKSCVKDLNLNETFANQNDSLKQECCEYQGLKECAMSISKEKCDEVASYVETMVMSFNGLGYEDYCKEDFSTCKSDAISFIPPTISLFLATALLSFKVLV